MTVNEIVSTLTHSSLPTIFVEGKDDIIVYRQFEKIFGARKVDFFRCNGRATLLEIFKRKDEFAHLNTHFIADKDMWVFVGIPAEYQDVFFTQGYSIENDLFFDGQYLVNGLLDSDEIILKDEILHNVIQWFASEVELYINGSVQDNHFSEVSLLNGNVMGFKDACFTQTFLNQRNIAILPNSTLITDIQENYISKLRGKFLFQIYRKVFEKHRKALNTKATVYSTAQLFDLCLREGIKSENLDSCMMRILTEIKQKFVI